MICFITAMSKCYYIGVDVGTSSVRAALVTGVGQVLSTATHSLRILEPDPDYFEQSSENIWDGCCKVIRVCEVIILLLCTGGNSFS